MALEMTLPAHVQALRPRTAALAILAAVSRLHGGVHVIGARELTDIVEIEDPRLRRRGCGCVGAKSHADVATRLEVLPRAALSCIVILSHEQSARYRASTGRAAAQRERGIQVIVVGLGGSSDDTVARADGADFVVSAECGCARHQSGRATRMPTRRCSYMRTTRPPTDADQHIDTALAGGARWGCFDVRIDGRSRWLGLEA